MQQAVAAAVEMPCAAFMTAGHTHCTALHELHIADALVTSELRNLQGQGQGVRRVRAYVDRVQQRMVDPSAPFAIVKESSSPGNASDASKPRF